ncbi:T9SS type A sorting domain-containing protein [bacterium]|nr:T9SS type A sorting domain-containing protein [bacterium]
MKHLFTSLLLLFAVNAMAQLGRPVRFDSIQYVTPQSLAKGNDEPSYFGDGRTGGINNGKRTTLTVEGVVCPMHPGYYGLSLSRRSTMVFSKDGAGRWSGLEVMADPGPVGSKDLATLKAVTKFYENFQPGLTVKFQGELGDYQGNTQLYLKEVETEVTNLTKTEITPYVIEIDSFKNGAGEDQYVTGEPYEQVYVEFKNVTVVNREEWSAGRWNWSVKNANGITIDIRDYSGYYRGDGAGIEKGYEIPNQSTWEPPAEGTVLDFIRGVIVQDTRAGYQLAPLVPEDLGLGSVVPAIISNASASPLVPTASDDITVSATIIDDVSVKAANVKYAVGINSTDWKTVAMSKVNGDEWQATVPKQADDSFVKIYIEAEDNEGNMSYGPDQSGMKLMVHVLNGGLRKISQIQMTPNPNGASIYDGKTLEGIVLNAVVTATVNYLGITVIQDSNDPGSAIFIKGQAGDGLSQLKRGDLLTITKASVEEINSVTHLSNIEFTKADGNGLPPAIMNVPIDSFQGQNPFAEGFEGMFMQWDNMVVADTAPDFPGYYGEFTFAKDVNSGTPQMRVDDFSPFIEQNFANDSLKPEQSLGFIKGIMFYSFGNWKLLPRDKNDIDGYHTRYPESVAEINKNINLQAYPNPTTGMLRVRFDAKPTDKSRISIVDLTGKTVYSENVSGGSTQIDLTSLNNGIYYLKIDTDSYSTAFPVSKH